jgi:hypothetical protein
MDDPKDDDVRISLHWNGIKKVRDFLLWVLPAAYVLGFFSWTTHNLSYGLGWVPTSLERYLALGFLALLLALLMAASLISLELGFRTLYGRMPRAAWTVWLLIPLAGALTFILYGFALDSVGILVSEQSLTWILLGMVGAFLLPLSQGMVFFTEWTLAKFTTWKLRDSNKEVIATTPLVMCIIFSTLAFPDFVAPNIRSEFGGCAPAMAKFEVHGEGIARLDRIGLITSWNHTSGLALTSPLYVFSTEDGFLVRDGSTDAGVGPLYQIDKSTVLTVYWIRR